MARAERRRPVRNERRWSWWWLAVPALAVAGYAAFAATLALLGDDVSRTPSDSARDAEQRLPMIAPAASSPTAPAAPADVVAAPAPLADAPADAPPAAEAAPAAEPGVLAAPTATAAAPRTAAGAARKVKPKRAPKEHLTEQDRRALDALVEQAGKNAR